MRSLRILPPLLLALSLTPALPRAALAQSTSLSWQCQTPSEHPPSGTQCPVNSSTPLPVSASVTPGGTQDVNIIEVGGNTVSTSVPVSGTLTADPAPATNAACSALCANLVAKGTAGQIVDFNVSADSTLSGAAWWLMVYAAASAPADGAVTPARCYAAPSGATSLSAAFPVPLSLANGITLGVSTTGCFTKTASTHAFISAGVK